MKLAYFTLLLLASLTTYAQRQTFDMISFIPPKGWSNEVKDFATSFTKTNSTSRGWCRTTIYKSTTSSGNAQTDFKNEWATLVSKNYPDAQLPPAQSTTKDGWNMETGGSKFKFNNEEAAAMLTTITGFGVEISIVVLLNNEEFMPDIETLFSSIQLQKPVAANEVVKTAPATNTPVNTATPQTNATPFTITSAPSASGISISTTNFDDGWVAQPFADYVKVVKGETTVLLHYGIEITEAMRNTNDVEGALWNQVIVPRYQLGQVSKYDNGGPCYFCIYFFEAPAVDKATGKSCYIGFRILKNSGVARCIEIISPSAGTMHTLFADQKKVEALINYNKFAITEADLMGTWEQSSNSSVDMYNVYTGSYAGMNTAASAHKFTFMPKGVYESTHNGATGMVGSMKFYSQKYNGESKVTNWDLTLTKRFNDKTEIFWAQFEAVRGGRIIHLTNKESSGNTYDLVKTK